MPYDILLCAGQDCPLRETCLRFTATIKARQDFFGHPPYNFTTHHCDYYWDERPTEEAIRQQAYQLWQNSGYEQNHALAHYLQAREQLIQQLRNS